MDRAEEVLRIPKSWVDLSEDPTQDIKEQQIEQIMMVKNVTGKAGKDQEHAMERVTLIADTASEIHVCPPKFAQHVALTPSAGNCSILGAGGEIATLGPTSCADAVRRDRDRIGIRGGRCAARDRECHEALGRSPGEH